MSDVPSEVVSAVVSAYGKARFEQSPELGQLFEALSQCEFPAIVRDRTAKIPLKSGGEYAYKYADLATLKEATQPELKKNKLAVVQQVGTNEKGIILRTVLGHASGQWLSATMEMPTAGLKAQDLGSAVTYARRYSRGAILDVASEDDDGSKATHGEDTSEPGGPIKAAPRPPPPASAPKSQPPSSDKPRTGVVMPFGKYTKGKDLADLTLKELSGAVDYLTKQIADPTNAQWAASNKQLMDACVLEAMKRDSK